MAGASAVNVTRAASGVRVLDTKPATIIGVTGIAERGPIGSSTPLTSFADYQQFYGGFLLNSEVPLQVKALFDEAGDGGGALVYMNRIVHFTAPGDPTTKTSATATLTLKTAAAKDTIAITGSSDGAYANALEIVVAPPNSGNAAEFNLQVLRNGVVAEEWVNLSLTPSSPRYAPTVIESGGDGQPASNLIALTNLLAAAPNLPAVGTLGPLTGGNDGLVGIADADWTGGVTSSGRTGLRVLDLIEDLALILCPGRATSAVHNGMVNYCEVVRGGLCFAIHDTPASLTAEQMIDYVVSTAMLQELSEMCAIYWPRIKLDNPATAIYGTAATLVAGPSGSVAGLCARLDQSKEGGAFEHPASSEKGVLLTARGLETDDVKDRAKRGLVFDALINPILIKRGTPVFVDGARTLKSTGPFPTVGESRGVLFVQITLTLALDPKRNQNIRDRLYNEMDMSASEFFRRLTAKECFASKTDAEAWYFDIGKALNTPSVQAARDVEARIGLATSKPAEFINVIIAPFQPAAATA